MGIVARAMGEQAEEQQEPVDNQAEDAAERGGKSQAVGGMAEEWSKDNVLNTARKLAEEIMYSAGGMDALRDRLTGSKDPTSEVADIVGNVLFGVQSKAKANGRMVPEQTMLQLAVTLIRQLFDALEIIGTVNAGNAKQLAKQILPKAMQAYAAAGQQGGQQRQPTPQPQGQQPQGGLAAQAMQGGV